MGPFISHPALVMLFAASALMACSGAKHPSGVVFQSSRKLDGTDAPNLNGIFNIWRASFDGTGLTPLTKATADGANNFSPQWSPDGSKVVFVSPRKPDGSDAPSAHNTNNIWRVSFDGTGLAPLTNATAVEAGSRRPQWSPNGSKVVFESSRNLDRSDSREPSTDGTTFNIWRVNADGSGLAPLTNARAGASGFSPQWSPDGSKIVFNSYRSLDGSDAVNVNFMPNIWRVNADGTGLVPLTTATQAASVFPQWSPDGSKVVFESSRKLDGTDAPNANGTTNIWRVKADGTGLVPLTTATAHLAHSHYPQWSPDGSQVVFESSRSLDGSDAVNVNFMPNIWRVNADGTGLVPLTTATQAASVLPHWSPDGSSVVFNSTRKLDGSDAPSDYSTSNLWRVNADGTGLMPLTTATAPGAGSGFTL